MTSPSRLLPSCLAALLLAACAPGRPVDDPSATIPRLPGEIEALLAHPDLHPAACLNAQIEYHNRNRGPADMGISPIDERVDEVRYDDAAGTASAHLVGGKAWLVLERQDDGRYRGTKQVPYHQLVGSGPGGSHSWGHVLVEFHLPARKNR